MIQLEHINRIQPALEANRCGAGLDFAHNPDQRSYQAQKGRNSEDRQNPHHGLESVRKRIDLSVPVRRPGSVRHDCPV